MKEEQHQQRRTGTSQNPEKLTKPPSNKSGEPGNNQTADTDQEKKTTNNSIKRKKELTGIRGSTKTFSK